MEKFSEFFKTNFLAFAILLSAMLVSGAMYYTSTQKTAPTAQRSAVTQDGGIADVPDVGDLPPQGNPNVKVTIVEFGDYQCPFCGRFYKNTEPKIIEEYVKTGKAKFYWRDLAFLGEESVWAAEAARCANEQGKFWEYHNLLFEKQGGENEGVFAKANLKQFARESGLNGSLFDSCLDSGKYRSKVEEERQKADQLGVNSTPTTFVGAQRLVGALLYDAFKEAIEAELKK